MANIEVEPLKPHIGARVHIDKADLLDDEVVRRCLEALDDRGVLVFPRLGLSDEEQLAFTDRLGGRVNYTRTVPGGDAAAPDVYKVTLDEDVNDHPEYVLGTYFWHIDGMTMNMPPPRATLLSARKLASRGGQTEFANTYAAYEHLPAADKAQIEELRALHTLIASMRPITETTSEAEALARATSSAEMEHPLVWHHDSGRKSLLVGTHADRVLDWPLADGRALLARLLEWTAQPDFRYTHHWQEGDLVIWDNCGTMHRVIPYEAKSGRTMHRTAIAGVENVNGSRVYRSYAESA